MLSRVLDSFRHLQKEFMSEGATHEEASLLAAAFVASPQGYSDRSRFFSAKNHPDALAYRFRGIAMEVCRLRVQQNREGSRSMALSLRARVERTIQEVSFKGEQALRVVALLAMKFERFEDDTCGGFLPMELREREFLMVAALTAQGQRIEDPDGDTVELTRNIRRKIEDKLRLFEFLRNSNSAGRCRFEIAPNHIEWDEVSWNFMELLTGGALSRWHDSYGFTGRQP